MLSISIIQIVQVSTYFRIRICTMRNFALRAPAHVVTAVSTVPSAADRISVVTKCPALTLALHYTALALQQTGSGPGDRMNFTVQELEQGSLGTRIVGSIQYKSGTHQRNCNLPP